MSKKDDDTGAAALWDSLSEDCKKNGRMAYHLTQKYFRLTGTELSEKEAEKSKGSI